MCRGNALYFRILRDEIINEDFPTVMKLVQVILFDTEI